jgi:hypothetical protein
MTFLPTQSEAEAAVLGDESTQASDKHKHAARTKNRKSLMAWITNKRRGYGMAHRGGRMARAWRRTSKSYFD